MPLLFKPYDVPWGPVKPAEKGDSFVSPFCMQAGLGFDAAPGPEEKAPSRPQQAGFSILKDAAQPEPSLDIPGLLKSWDTTYCGSGMLPLNSTRLPSFDMGWVSRSSGLLPDIALSWTPSQALLSPSSPHVASPQRPPPAALEEQGHPTSAEAAGASYIGGLETKMGLRRGALGLPPLPVPAIRDSLPMPGDAGEDAFSSALLYSPPGLGHPQRSGEREAGRAVPGLRLGQGPNAAPRSSGLMVPVSEPQRQQQGWRKRSGFGGLFPRHQSLHPLGHGASISHGMGKGERPPAAMQREPSLRGGGLPLPSQAPTAPTQSRAKTVAADMSKVVIERQPNSLSLSTAQAQQKRPPASAPALQPYAGAWGTQLHPGALIPNTWMEYVRSGCPNLYSPTLLPPSAITTGCANPPLSPLTLAAARRPPGTGSPAKMPQAELAGGIYGTVPHGSMKPAASSVKSARDGDGGDSAAPARVMSPSWSSSNQTRQRALPPLELARGLDLETPTVSSPRSLHLTSVRASLVSS